MSETVQNERKQLAYLLSSKIYERHQSVRAAAIEMGIAQSHLDRILKGSLKIGAAAALKIAPYLELPTDTVLRMAGHEELIPLLDNPVPEPTPIQKLSPLQKSVSERIANTLHEQGQTYDLSKIQDASYAAQVAASLDDADRQRFIEVIRAFDTQSRARPKSRAYSANQKS